jgi:hypothetical protein
MHEPKPIPPCFVAGCDTLAPFIFSRDYGESSESVRTCGAHRQQGRDWMRGEPFAPGPKPKQGSII